jgi:cytochrome c1
MRRARVRHAALAVLAVPVLAACGAEGTTAAAPREEREAALAALQKYGCGSCHRIPHVAGAHGDLGPPLVHMGRRVYIGRSLPNTPENMRRWIQSPQAIAPGTAMPDLGVSEREAQAIAAYLLAGE